MSETKKQGIFGKALAGLGFSRTANSEPTKTFGSFGATVIGGYLQENEKHPKLVGREKYVTYANILANTTIVAAGTRYFLNLLTSASWKAEPVEVEDEADREEADLRAKQIEYIITHMDTPWHRVVRRAAMFRFYGFSVQEKTARRIEDGEFAGVIGLADVSPRPQSTIERWDVDDHGYVYGVVQRSPQTSQDIYLPRSKLVYLVDDSLNDSPEGLGLFRNVVEPAARLARYEQLEGFGFETDLRGIPVVRIPYTALQQAVEAGSLSEEDAQAAITRLESFVTKHLKNPQLGLALDSMPYTATDEAGTPSTVRQFDIDLLEGDGANFEAVGSAIDRINHEIARVLGVEQLLLGQTRGTQALSEDKSHNFALIIDSTLLELQETMQKDIVAFIFELNGWDKKFVPNLVTDKIQHRDLMEVGQVLKDLATAGAVLSQDDPAVNAVRRQLGLPNAAPLSELELEDLTIPGTPSEEGGSEEEEEGLGNE